MNNAIRLKVYVMRGAKAEKSIRFVKNVVKIHCSVYRTMVNYGLRHKRFSTRNKKHHKLMF